MKSEDDVKSSSSAERRIADRKDVQSIVVSDVTSLSSYGVIMQTANIVDASSSGFLMLVDRKDLGTKELKQSLTLDMLIGHQVVMFLPDMNLDLDGFVRRTAHLGKGLFEVAVEFSADVPEYWRECLVDLLPAPGELEEEEK